MMHQIVSLVTHKTTGVYKKVWFLEMSITFSAASETDRFN